VSSTKNNLKRMQQKGREHQWYRWTKDSKDALVKKRKHLKRKQTSPQLVGSTPNLRKIGFQPQMPSVGATELSQPS